jgi:hypothetical protein
MLATRVPQPNIPLHVYLFARCFSTIAFIYLLDLAYSEIGSHTYVGRTGGWVDLFPAANYCLRLRIFHSLSGTHIFRRSYKCYPVPEEIELVALATLCGIWTDHPYFDYDWIGTADHFNPSKTRDKNR